MAISWDDEKVARIRALLAETPSAQYEATIARIGCTDEQLRGAFRRRGLGHPRTHCIDPLDSAFMSREQPAPVPTGAPVAALDYDDEDTRPARDTVPAPACRAHVDREPEPDTPHKIARLDPLTLPHGDLERILALGDIHAPFHDEQALRVVEAAARVLRPHTLVQVGDLADMFSVSAHDKRPDRRLGLKDEIVGVNAVLDRLDALGAVRKVITLGNHEHRWDRYLMTKAPELWGMSSIEELLHLRERGWHVVQYRDAIRIGKVAFTHDCGQAGVYAANRARATFEGCVAMGHVHRAGIQYEGNAKGEMHFGAALGWLGSITSVDYMHKINALRSWCHAFGVGYMEPSGVVHFTVHPIVRGRAVVAGTLVAA